MTGIRSGIIIPAWIDTTFIAAEFTGGEAGEEIRVDSLGVRLLGLSMGGSATSEPDALAGGAWALLETTELIRRFVPQAPQDLRMAARVGIELGGTPTRPDADVTVDAAAIDRFQKDGLYPSDHYPVTATLVFPGR